MSLLTIEQVADMLGVSVGAIRNRCSRGTLPYLLNGRKRMFDQAEVERYLRRHRSDMSETR